MSRLEVTGLCRRFGRQIVLDRVDLTLESGTIAAVLGASGCGKTTLLRLIAGFDRADAGTIAIGGTPVAGGGLHIPPERRRIGYVPQEGALFPHLTVADNVGFGLKRDAARAPRIAAMLTLTGLQGLESRYPAQLSGGQQQRAALARALAPAPSLVLLDEPFNALDIELRRTVCADVIAALRITGATAFLVTHDPQEAFASADRLGVMHAGRMMQMDDPAAIYRTPADPVVAGLTGATLFLDGTAVGDVVATALGPVVLRVPHTGPVTVLVRPEQIALAGSEEGVAARITAQAFRGDHMLVTLQAGGVTAQLRLPDSPGPGTAIRVRVAGPCSAWAKA